MSSDQASFHPRKYAIVPFKIIVNTTKDSKKVPENQQRQQEPHMCSASSILDTLDI